MITPLFRTEAQNHPLFKQYPQLTTEYDEANKAAYFYMNATPVASFTPTLLESIKQWFSDLAAHVQSGSEHEVNYLVLASKHKSVFNLGGDLSVIKHGALNQDRDALLDYAHACIEVLYRNMMGLGLGIKTISLVQGDALGGGLEAALSSDVIIAERGTSLGLPESLFGLFPGMGAYQLLSRRIPCREVEKMIRSGRKYTAEELYDLGVVDYLAEPEQGNLAVRNYIKNAEKNHNVDNFLNHMKHKTYPITYADLEEVIHLWVESALQLTRKNLKFMSMLRAKQQDL